MVAKEHAVLTSLLLIGTTAQDEVAIEGWALPVVGMSTVATMPWRLWGVVIGGSSTPHVDLYTNYVIILHIHSENLHVL